MWSDMDPRSKIFATLCLTSMALLVRMPLAALLLAALTTAALIAFGIDPKGPLKTLIRLAPAMLVVAVLQVLLVRSGRTVLSAFGIGIVTTGGLGAAAFMVVRVGIIAACGYILSSIGFADFLLAMKSMKVPYEIAFMAAMGAKFLPLLAEEMTDSLTSAELRGADIKRMGIIRRLRLYSEVLMPATFTALSRAEGISWALELRGFNPGAGRTYWRKLEMRMSDWMAFPLGIIAFAAFLLANY